MVIKEYLEFVLVADQVELKSGLLKQFSVQVFSSPAGEGKRETRRVPEDLQRYLERLETGKLQVKSIVALGETLSDLLLPDKVRSFFVRSLEKLKPDQGLRIRLRLDPALADVPWEYMYIQHVEGEKDMTGFLALDPRLSIVRHEAVAISGELSTIPKKRQMLVVLSNSEDRPLNLQDEKANIQKALQKVDGIQLEFLENPNIEQLSDHLLHGVDIFHFAGHGAFDETAILLGEDGGGEIAIRSISGTPTPIRAEQLAMNLRGRGVQLAFLGACETGRRDGKNVWNSVAAALMETGIPIAVAMQYEIEDHNAIVFSNSFYKALAAGFSVDEAVSAGRLAVFNVVHPLLGDPGHPQYWRDWGVPVLYLRSGQNFVLPAVIDAPRREAIANDFRIKLDHRFQQIGEKGKYLGVEAGVIKGGAIEAYLKVGNFSGSGTQINIGKASGKIDILSDSNVGTLNGDFVGVNIGVDGKRDKLPGGNRGG